MEIEGDVESIRTVRDIFESSINSSMKKRSNPAARIRIKRLIPILRDIRKKLIELEVES